MNGQTSAKILVIDDDINARLIFEDFLTDAGYEVVTVPGYNSALAALATYRFDLLFADIILGDQNGIEILREVKRLGWDCPVIMITGAPAMETAVEALRLGAYDYISKPIDIRTAVHITQKALQYKKVLDESERYRSNLEAIFRSVKDAIITVDSETRLIEANPAAEAICGLNLQESLGMKFADTQTPCSKFCSEVYQTALLTGRTIKEYRVECQRQDVPNQVVVVTSSPLQDQHNQRIGAVLVKRDITSLVQIQQQLLERHQFAKMVGRSEKMQEVFNLLENLTDLETTVLITGESGTGKELVAHGLHYGGTRALKPLIKVNCTALADNLLESELFGHVRGAFTGAIKDQIGRFQLAHGGSIFLDEIGDISPQLQLKLLRVLQEKEIERVGDAKTIKVDVRVIAATNRDLKAMMRTGEFREDLYYRLKVVEITLPPLRERQEDIPLMVEHFCQELNKSFKKNIEGIAKGVLEKFMSYPWPGNARELRHVLEYAFVVCPGRWIEFNHLPADFKAHENNKVTPVIPANTEAELQILLDALEKAGWNKAKAARNLGISRRTIHRKIVEYNIVTPSE